MPCSKLLSHHVKNPNVGIIQSLVNVRRGLFSTCKGKLRLGLLKKRQAFQASRPRRGTRYERWKAGFLPRPLKIDSSFRHPGLFFPFWKQSWGFWKLRFWKNERFWQLRGFGFRQNCDLDDQIEMNIFQLVRFCNFEKFWALQNPLVKQKSGAGYMNTSCD